jgi:hypothetical protein
MKELDNTNWASVQGIDSSGLSIKSRLEELLAGVLIAEEQVDLLVDLCREGVASTAGYAAIPILIHGQAKDARTAWQMAHAACLVIGAVGLPGSPPVPAELLDNVSDGNRRMAIKSVLSSGAEAELGTAELLDSLSAVLAVLNRTELAEVIGELALKEYGVGFSLPPTTLPPMT